MYDIADIQDIPPFSMGTEEKDRFLTKILGELTAFHYGQSPEYKRILDAWPFDVDSIGHYRDIPYLPDRKSTRLNSSH